MNVLTEAPDSVIKIIANYLPPDKARQLYIELMKLSYTKAPEKSNGRQYVHSIKSGSGLQTYADEVK